MTLRSVWFVNGQTGFAAGTSGTVLKTTNGGTNWIQVNANNTDRINSIYFFDANTGIYCALYGIIRRTTNGGASWDSVYSGTTNWLYAISFYGVNGICTGGLGNFNDILLYSTNAGSSWSIAAQGSPEVYLSAHMVTATLGYAVGEDSSSVPKVGKTANSGSNWSYFTYLLNSNKGVLYSVHFINLNEGFTAAVDHNNHGAISYTSNGGQNWSSQLFNNGLLGIDFPSQNIGYAVGDSGTIFKTTDKGITWNAQISGISDNLRAVDFVDNLTGYAVGWYGRILKTTNGGVTSIHQISSEVREFKLYQNYPNPFNPETKIKFNIRPPLYPLLAKEGTVLVLLKIYDIMGREVATLINQQLNPGTYEISWDASRYTSGIYFYKLISGGNTAIKKMVLLK
jgi:photosystem II stability/assembly factor-like uncharacterized protein